MSYSAPVVAPSSKRQYEVLGWVSRTEYTQRDQPAKFYIKTSEGIEYTCFSPFFCPVDEGDCVFGLVSQGADRSLTFVRQPFVQLPVAEESVKACFIRALRGSGFGQISAADLYSKLESLAKLANYCRIQHKKAIEEKDAEVEAEATPVGPTVIVPGIPKSKEKTPEQSQLDELKSGPDGVIAYISELSVQYHKTSNPIIIEGLVAGTKLKHGQIQSLLRWWHQRRSMRRLHLLGLTNKEIKSSYKSLDEIYDICMSNPYRIPSIPIEKAEAITRSMRKEPSATEIVCGQIVRKMFDMLETQGSSCTPLWLIVKLFSTFHKLRETLVNEYEVIIEHNAAYLGYPHKVESFIAEYINRKIKKSAEAITALPVEDTPELESAMYLCKTLTKEQKIAIQGALQHDICIITGGAGVGKSTIINEIVRNLQIREIPFCAGAYTGKAVARLQDILKNRNCVATIDRMISRASGIPPFKCFLIDEGSMLTTELMYRFKKAFPFDFRLIIVGDCNQLQPIGWGTFMKQIMACRRVPVYTLTVNQRIIKHVIDEQVTGEAPLISGPSPGEEAFDRVILDNANALIEEGRDLSHPVDFRQGVGFYEIEGGTNMVFTIIKSLYDAGIEYQRITVISPYNEYLQEINVMFQNIFLADAKKMMDTKRRQWRVGDRIMMLVNNYDINIMNGEEGHVIDLTDEGVVGRFKDGADHVFLWNSSRTNQYTPRIKQDGGKMGEALTEESWEEAEITIENIQHSAALTVHKSQGSEYEFNIVYIPQKGKMGQGSGFLNINLLYTAITRTRRALWIVGSSFAVGMATCRVQGARYENLCCRLAATYDKELEAPLDTYARPMLPADPWADSGEMSHDDFAPYEN